MTFVLQREAMREAILNQVYPKHWTTDTEYSTLLQKESVSSIDIGGDAVSPEIQAKKAITRCLVISP